GAVPSELVPAADAPRPVQRVRIRYRKVGLARFIGTREMSSIFARAAKRAGLPIAFTNGHHPLPRFAFGPALPVGCSSDDEYLDAELTAACAPAALVRALGAELPDGFVLLDGEEIPPGTASIDASVAACVWRVDVSALDAPPSRERLAAAVAAFFAAPALPVRKTVKGKPRTVDARAVVRRLAVVADDAVEMEITAGPEGSVKPSALLGELLALPERERPLLRVHKTATRFRTPAPTAAPHAA
ncbi:MAG TPA: TIGR03936 family radical SAM-associated protein, partial [Candidatus Limnocylindria bacterium]|nr:TIGR03936 family radical SAM-associated protein [Candidatus Limnocylindria bacterium]